MGIPLYNSRQIARRLDINLSRWKRWSREFLPPDPLAGMQSGYTRQYYLDDAFQVYLGGHLVARLHFSVPEARRVLADLTPWMKAEGLRFDLLGRMSNGSATTGADQTLRIRIYRSSDGFVYRMRQRLQRRRIDGGGQTVWEERWAEATIGGEGGENLDETRCRTLRLSALIAGFRSKVVTLEAQP